MLYVDISIAALTAYRGDLCASIYLPTTPSVELTMVNQGKVFRARSVQRRWTNSKVGET